MKTNYKYIKRSLIVITVISLFYSCSSISFDNMSSSDFMETLKSKVTKKSNGNLAMVIIENGEVFDSYYQSNGKPVNENTIFQMASLSKFVTTIGIMKLKEDGLIELDKPVSNYLTRWNLPESKYDNNKVTIR